MFIAWSDADADWVEEIEIVSSFECKYVFNPLGGGASSRMAEGEERWRSQGRKEDERVSMNTFVVIQDIIFIIVEWFEAFNVNWQHFWDAALQGESAQNQTLPFFNSDKSKKVEVLEQLWSHDWLNSCKENDYFLIFMHLWPPEILSKIIQALFILVKCIKMSFRLP